MNDSITAIPGVEVGHWTDAEASTGCTVVVLPEPNRVVAEARGGAPGSREYALLQPDMRVEQVQAILLTGGSAFGLAAADGVVRGLEADGRGHETPMGRVPIVPAAVIFDLFPDFGTRPGPDEGEMAYRARSSAPVVTGRVGAGTGATVAKWRGFENAMPGGLGTALRSVGDSTVGALVVLNAVGDVFSVSGEALTGGPHVPGPPEFLDELPNTTLVVLATDAEVSRSDLRRLVVRAHDALAALIRPVHTRYDGDLAFAASVGSATADLDALGEAAFAATAAAVENSLSSANPA